MEILIGLILVVIGLAVAFFGLRFWFILLPIFGAIIGFFVGAKAIQAIFGEGFLATATSWIVGIVVGIAFALLSWFIWYAGTIIQAGAVGAMLFSGILQFFWNQPWGWVNFLVALAGAIIFAVGALMLALPLYIVIVNSAIGGTSLAVAGAMMVFGLITLQEVSNGNTIAVVDEVRVQNQSWFWLLAWIIVVVAGIWYQIRSMNEVRLPEEKWVPARAS
jgi:hypothetical protein